MLYIVFNKCVFNNKCNNKSTQLLWNDGNMHIYWLHFSFVDHFVNTKPTWEGRQRPRGWRWVGMELWASDLLSLHCGFLICMLCLVAQSCPILWPHGLQPVRLLCPWGFSRQEYRSGLPCPPPGDLPNPGIEPKSPAFQVDSLPSEPPGKPKNTGEGRLSFLQCIFLTQESNGGLLHYRQVLYQLSHQGSHPHLYRG